MEDVFAVLAGVICVPALGMQQAFEEVDGRQFEILRRTAIGEDVLKQYAKRPAKQPANSVDVGTRVDIIK